MRYGRRDSTHREIVRMLEAVGASVFDSADVGGGFPDLVVGYRGKTYLMEVKGPKGKLRASQVAFGRRWKGTAVDVVRTAAEALIAIGLEGTAALLTGCARGLGAPGGGLLASSGAPVRSRGRSRSSAACKG